MSNNQIKMTTQEARCGVRLNYVIFPIDFRLFRHALAKNGYELSPVGRIPAPPTHISFTGELARKGEITVILETDSGDISVLGRFLQEAKDSFEELANVINSELGISLHENVRFYWYTVYYNISTGKTPRNEIAKVKNENYIARFSQVLGESLSSFSIRLYPKDSIPNQESWFDVNIEPDILNEKMYHVGVAFRSPDKGKTETFLRNLENNLLKLIKIIEE